MPFQERATLSQRESSIRDKPEARFSKDPVSFEIEVSRKVGCDLSSNEVHFVSLAENFTV